MAIVGFNYLKFDAEKKKGAAVTGGIEVKHNLKVNDVEKTTLGLGGSQTEVLRVEFSFDILYGSGLGKIGIVGEVLYTDTKEIIEESVKGWEKEKDLNLTVKKEVHKFVYNKSIVRSIELADSLGMPSPIPMPKFKYEEGPKK